jgi:DNA-binding IclR family transcriptional regulator
MSIAVLDKAFSLVEVLARAARPITLADLAEESRFPKPTVYRILHSLRDLGYVEQVDRRGAYRLSARLASLSEHVRDQVVRDKALPLMRRLHEAFDETVNLGLLEGVYIRYAHVLETAQPLRWIVKPGVRDVFHTTALGRAIVAFLPGQQQERLVAKASSMERPANRRALRSKLERELAATRTCGCAIEEEETVAGVACMAAPLGALGEPLAAVSVAIPIYRFTQARREALLKTLHFGSAESARKGRAVGANL